MNYYCASRVAQGTLTDDQLKFNTGSRDTKYCHKVNGVNKTNLIIFFLLIHLSFQFFDLELKINLSLNLKFATRTQNIYNKKQSSLTGVSRRMFSICLIHTHGKHFNILEMKNRSFFMLFLFSEWILN